MNDKLQTAFDAFSKVGALKLDAAEVLQTDQPLQVKVTDLDTGAPVGGATVNFTVRFAMGD